ncbi:MAG TPA: hypothetical protein VF066_08090 [Thermoleophilaceae bacterium]
MGRGLAGVLVVFFAFVAPASAADTIVGSGKTAWGAEFVLSVSEEKGPTGPEHCLNYADADGADGGCPLERPPADQIDAETSISCERRHVTVYGALDARVARVIVRLVGGRAIEARIFEPQPAIDPQMAYWVASFKGLRPVRSITTVATDGSVLARDRNPTERPCEEDRNAHARRYPIAALAEPGGQAWQLSAYRGLIDDEEADGHHLVRTLCFEVTQLPRDPINGASSSSCGVGISRKTRALSVEGDGVGCNPGRLILYGLARSTVGRIVIRSRAGWAVAVPKAGPPRLHAPARLWSALVAWPPSGIVIDAQDRRGRTIAKQRIKPAVAPGVSACAGSFFGSM